MKALLITVANLTMSIPCETCDLDWARKHLDCEYIEIVRPVGLPRKFVMLIDEEGKLKEHYINPICSKLYGYDKHGDYIAGNALIVKEERINGEPDLCGMDDGDLEELQNAILKALKGGE